MKYIDSLSDNEIRKMLRAIYWPDFTDEEFIEAGKSGENFRTKEAHDRFVAVSSIFPQRLVNEIVATSPESREKFVHDTTVDTYFITRQIPIPVK